MTADRHVITIRCTTLTPPGEPERAWCDDCALPSAFAWRLAIEANGRLLDDAITTLRWCFDCGRQVFE